MVLILANILSLPKLWLKSCSLQHLHYCCVPPPPMCFTLPLKPLSSLKTLTYSKLHLPHTVQMKWGQSVYVNTRVYVWVYGDTVREQRANWLCGGSLEGGSEREGVCVRKRLSVLIKVQTDAVERSKNSQKGPKTAGFIPLSYSHAHAFTGTQTSCCS